jgi:2-dehydropantoate 2-reductase
MNENLKKTNINDICCIGVGGVGGYFGGKITQKIKAPQKIYFIARGKHKEVIAQRGLELKIGNDSKICRPFLVTENITDVPNIDLCFICVKSYDLNDVVTELAKKVKDNTIIIPLLNGVDIYERIRSRLKSGIILPACVYIGTHIEQPGVVVQNGGDAVILFGKDPRHLDYDPQPILDFLTNMEINFKWHNDSAPAIWEKYIFIASFGIVTGYSGKTLGEVMANSKLKDEAAQIMKEIVLLADKKEIKLPSNIIEISLAKANKFPYATKTSYQRDLEKGLKNEGDLFGETIIQIGEELNIATPITLALYRRSNESGRYTG